MTPRFRFSPQRVWWYIGAATTADKLAQIVAFVEWLEREHGG